MQVRSLASVASLRPPIRFMACHVGFHCKSHSVWLLLARVITATDAPGKPYQFGSSLGAGPTPVGKLLLGLARDDLLMVSVFGLWPQVFRDYTGTLDAAGKARAMIAIPRHSVLIGTRIHTAAVTLDPARPSGIRSVSQTTSFTIVK